MRDILSKLDKILNEATTLDDLKKLPGAEDPVIAKAIADKEKEEQQTDEDLFQIGDEFGISFSEDYEISSTIVDILEDGIVIELDDFALETMTSEGISFIDHQVVEDISDRHWFNDYEKWKMAVSQLATDDDGRDYAKLDGKLIAYWRGVDGWIDRSTQDVSEEKQKGLDGKACWKGYKRMGTKMKGGKRVDNCVKMGEDSNLEEKSFPFAGKEVGHKEGPAGWLKGKDKRPAKPGDLVGGSESIEYDVDEAKYQGREVPLGKPMKGDVKKSKVYVKKPNGKIVKVNFGDKKMRIKKSNPSRRKSFRARHNCSNPGPRWKARYWSCRAW